MAGSTREVSSSKTKKGTKSKRADGSTHYTYTVKKGENKGRKVTAISKGKGKPATTSQWSARNEKEKSSGRKLPKDKHVAHKEGTTKKDTHPSKTRVESAKKNIGDGNRARKRRKR
jgi:hypothetical protein